MDFWDHQECHASTVGAIRQQLQQSREGSPVEASCMHLPGKTRICAVNAVLGTLLAYNSKVPDGGVLRFLQQKLARPGDVFHINFGAWHRKSLKFPYNMAGYQQALTGLAKYYQETRDSFPHVFFWHTPAAHPNWGDGRTCMPYKGVSLDPVTAQLMTSGSTLRDLSSNSYTSLQFKNYAEDTLARAGIPVLGDLSYNMSMVLEEQHVGMMPDKRNSAGYLDCIHYCHPGLPEV